MSGSVNKAILVGNLGRDPEIRTTQSGQRCATLSVATSESWRDKQSGEKRENVQWHRVVIWNDKLVDVVEKYCTKGQKVYLEGQIQTRKWQDQSGADRYSTEIVLSAFKGTLTMLDRGNRGDGPDEAEQSDGYEAPATGREHGSVGGGYDLDDEIPF